MPIQCSVFISSTSEDLKEYRLAARDAALAAGFRPVMMEYFAASGGPPLSECLSRVSPCDLVVALGKQAYYTQIDLDQPKAYAYAKEVMSMNSLAADAQEGISAFLEKRQACWSGR